MSSKTDFERKLMELDQNKLYGLLEGAILMYVEYQIVHGHEKNSAVYSAIHETLTGVQAMIELDDSGDL